MDIKVVILCGLLLVLIMIIHFRTKKMQDDISKLKRASVHHELEIRKLKKQLGINDNETS